MSFILDALRKSEDERQRDAAPSISRAPMTVPRDRLPRWAMGVMVALAVCVLALTGAWWSSQRSSEVPSGATVSPENVAAPPVVQSRPRTVPRASSVDPRPAPVEARPASVEASAGAEPQARAASDPSRSLSALVVEPEERAAPVAESTSPAGPLPSLGEIRAQGIAIPVLDLQLLSYGAAADERFVFINGARYVEGELVEDDLRVVAIRRDGAVVSRRGREFLLVPE
ncbi:general secretion pathway protein GspB [Candidatus Rariloculus sp.]|uniref:general secretion pathway protein GspB n=1 Tax=Candidatus Rariloculus sp. TaxID=3101265 RepID=UPI003D14B0F8